MSARAEPRFASLVLTATAFWLVHSPTSAELILDDFVDPAEVVSPEMFNTTVETANVGPLHATRGIRIGGGPAPIGRLDAAVTTPSVLTGTIGDLNAGANGRVLVGPSFSYLFEPSDISEDGRNDTIFVDFRSLASNIPPDSMSIAVLETNSSYSYLHRVEPLPTSEDPFTLAIRFDEITERTGLDLTPNYEEIVYISFSVAAAFFWDNAPDELGFDMQVEAVRVGAQRVPELTGIQIGLVMLALLATSTGRYVSVYSASRTREEERWNRSVLW